MMSGQELWTLVQHGWIPRGLVLGLCVYHVAHLSFRQTLQTAGQNTELGVYTEAVYDAREIAMARMQYEAQVLAADGVVGVNVQEASWIWGGARDRVPGAGHRGEPDRDRIRPGCPDLHPPVDDLTRPVAAPGTPPAPSRRALTVRPPSRPA